MPSVFSGRVAHWYAVASDPLAYLKKNTISCRFVVPCTLNVISTLPNKLYWDSTDAVMCERTTDTLW